MSDAEQSDHELLRRWCAGTKTAGNELIRRLEPRLRRFFGSKVRPQDLDDLVQRTWLAMTQTSRRTTSEEPDDAIHTSVQAYLFGIARYVLIAYHRQNCGRVRFDPEVDSIDALAPSLSRQLSLHRRIERLEAALRSLPIDLQMLTEARYIDELSGPELAEMFGIPEGTVRSRLHRARRMVDEALARMSHN